MNLKLNLIKILFFLGAFFVLSFITPQKTFAACTWSGEIGPDPGINPSQNNCHNTGGGGSSGNVVYSCGTYFMEGLWQTGCYSHQFNCDSPCSGPGVPGGGGGGIPSCDGVIPGTVLVCGSPSTIDCVNNAQNCYSQYPSIFRGWEAGDPPPSCEQAYPPQSGKQFCQTNCGCCFPGQTYVNGSGCVTPCTPSSPSAPALSTPADGVTTGTLTPFLMWDKNAQTWGTG